MSYVRSTSVDPEVIVDVDNLRNLVLVVHGYRYEVTAYQIDVTSCGLRLELVTDGIRRRDA